MTATWVGSKVREAMIMKKTSRRAEESRGQERKGGEKTGEEREQRRRKRKRVHVNCE